LYEIEESIFLPLEVFQIQEKTSGESDQAMESKEAFSVNQLEKIANYFKRNLR
jgi:hypothetical protein